MVSSQIFINLIISEAVFTKSYKNVIVSNNVRNRKYSEYSDRNTMFDRFYCTLLVLSLSVRHLSARKGES